MPRTKKENNSSEKLQHQNTPLLIDSAPKPSQMVSRLAGGTERPDANKQSNKTMNKLERASKIVWATVRENKKRLESLIPGSGSLKHRGHKNTWTTDSSRKFFIDRACLNGQNLQIDGWFFDQHESVTSITAALETKEGRRSFDLDYGIDRPDVLSQFGAGRSLKSGFSTQAYLDPRWGRLSEAKINICLEHSGDIEPYVVPLKRAETNRLKTIKYMYKHANRKELQLILWDLLKLRLDSLLLRLDDFYIRTHRRKAAPSKIPRSRTLLKQALKQLDDSPVLAPDLHSSVDILIPVYNGLEHLDPLFTCLQSHTDSRHRIIVIDDGNTEKAILDRLTLFKQTRDNVVLIRRETNGGFVQAINAGAHLVRNDFVILNTDVVLPPLWLERLIAPLQQNRKVASVTPFTNSGSICSFPKISVDNTIYGGLDVTQIDEYFQLVNKDSSTSEIPTGVGFCMAINYSAWEKIGPFDAKAFGEGYGEENDWCLRASDSGYKHLICKNLFVYHKHGGSFTSQQRQLLRRNAENIINQRYPHYADDVKAFHRLDPLRALREILSILIACKHSTPPPSIIVDHQLGGGTNIYRSRRVTELVDRGSPVFELLTNHNYNGDESRFLLRFSFNSLTIELIVEDLADLEVLLSLIGRANIIINNTIGDRRPLELIEFFRKIKETRSFSLSIMIHDYYCICPSYTLLDHNTNYCEIPEDLSVCASCLAMNTLARNPNKSTIPEWRSTWERLMNCADRVICFSESSRTIISKAFPKDASNLIIEPHSIDTHFNPIQNLKSSGRFTIGVVGSIGVEKGSPVVSALSAYLEENDIDCEILVIGIIYPMINRNNVRVLGPYERSSLPTIVASEGISVFLVPSICPETFSFVTSELMALDVPVAAFDLGAPPERLRSYRRGLVLQKRCITDPHALYIKLKEFSNVALDH